MFSNLLIPPWAKIAAPLLIVVAVFFCGWTVNGWRLSGKMEKKEAQRAEAVEARQAAEALEAVWRSKIIKIQEDLRAKEVAYDKLEAIYLEEVQKDPEIVVEYRDRVRTVTETIVSEDCKQGLVELVRFIQDLPERTR
jgi:hypothetical protein